MLKANASIVKNLKAMKEARRRIAAYVLCFNYERIQLKSKTTSSTGGF
ncbi:hypothetical protein DRA42_12075 [Ethanoligenens harbinense]|nr:hypothetical protein CXQ68_12040 [Ethanoligenens harbinense YUAN-3]AYF39535.1 hypothetical protein CXP51_11935 [Ethanoligenens harbinense]AYF42360.1 hypothetical protein CN246_12485 [Ethanoligenens harbinense]QCN93113.1 hypothetical protein DRA42_12075 [Ethanoligenens harbinense]